MDSSLTTGIIVFAHGSRLEPANESVRAVAADLARTCGFSNVVAAFLELGRPSLVEAAGSMVTLGINRVIVAPYFLTPGMHLDRDLPNLISQISAEHPQLEIVSTPPLDGHPALTGILMDRIAAKLSA